MTKVYFVRHAQPNYNNHDDMSRELSSKGMSDRKLVTEFLKDKEIARVYSSPYKRAVDTVKDFADHYGFEIGIVDDFRERMIKADEWIEDFQTFSRKQWEDFDYKHVNGESLREVQTRNIQALNQVLDKNKGKNIVIGSHGTALSTIVNFYDSSFGYESFERIRLIMPWIVELTFEGNQCIKIQEYEVC